MTDSQLDEIFKKQLPGHESPVPEDMWERIIRKRDKDRKGFFFFFSLIGLFLLGFGVAVILLFGTNKKGIKRNSDTISTNKAFSNSDTVHSTVTTPDLKTNSTVHHEGAFVGIDTVQKIARHKDYQKKRISYIREEAKTYRVPLKKENGTTGIGQAQSKKNSDTSLSESNGSPDSSRITEKKVVPILPTTPKTVTSDSVKTTTAKKSDSTKKDINSKWSLNYYASPDYPVHHGQEYLQGKLSYTIGVKVNRTFGKHLSGEIGIQFSQLNYTLTDTIYIAGPFRLNRVDVPVLAGYSWGNETLGMTVNAGFILNLYSWGADSIGYIKSNTGLSLYLGFNFSKHINERIDIFSEPYYRYQLSPMANYPNYFPNYIDVVGLTFGVRFHFKK
jgi:hypothetical protein